MKYLGQAIDVLYSNPGQEIYEFGIEETQDLNRLGIIAFRSEPFQEQPLIKRCEVESE
jgi:hypothetical protein